jgi:hypothetical protein
MIVLASALFVAVNGVDVFLYRGTPVPEGIDPELLEGMLERGDVGTPPDEDAVTLAKAPEGDPSTSWTVAQLDAYIAEHGVAVDGRATKAAKVAAIDEARAVAVVPAEVPVDDGYPELNTEPVAE